VTLPTADFAWFYGLISVLESIRLPAPTETNVCLPTIERIEISESNAQFAAIAWSNCETKMLNVLNSLLGRHPERVKAQVELYTWQTCPFCIRAKGVNFTEYKIDGDGAARVRMAERANGRRTVPQIFINNQHIGGCDDLYELDRKGQLDPLLAESASESASASEL
jgi:glutaredoxin 3